MPEDYDDITAKHYAAFRPALHEPILSRCVRKKQRFNLGLDVGCGTGRSTIALAKYCNAVIGIDPSTEMLKNAIQNPKIEYINGFLEESNMKASSFEIATFAGVLFYSKSQKLYNELIRVTKRGSQIIIYDFEVVLKGIFELFDLHLNTRSKSSYNHEVNFSEMNDGKLLSKTIVKDKASLSISSSDLSHLILSEKTTYVNLELKYGAETIFDSVRNIIRKQKGETIELETNIFYSIYENRKAC